MDLLSYGASEHLIPRNHYIIARRATTYFALGALTPHTNRTLSFVTPEPTRELAEPRDTLIEETESRLQNTEEHKT